MQRSASPSPVRSGVGPQRDLELAGLLARVARGDQVALAAFYDATSRLVFALAQRLVGDRQKAEEVLIDVYLQVWRKAATYLPERGRATSWLLALARSRALDRVRHDRSGRRAEHDGLPASEPAADDSFDPSQSPLREERCLLVRQALSALPQEQRRALELAYFTSLSHAEISSRTGEPLGTVKTRIRLGLIKLRETLRPLEAVQ